MLGATGRERNGSLLRRAPLPLGVLLLDGASHPEELVARAAELGYPALALTDHDGVYGSLEFAHAAKHAGIRPITGAEVTVDSGVGSTEPPRSGGAGFAGAGAGTGRHVTLLCESGKGYANLCRILTAAHAGTRRPGREDREPLPPAVLLETVAG
jgi:error-prone DNA polymerase